MAAKPQPRAFGAAIALDNVVLALVGSVALCGLVAALERIPRSRDW